MSPQRRKEMAIDGCLRGSGRRIQSKIFSSNVCKAIKSSGMRNLTDVN